MGKTVVVSDLHLGAGPGNDLLRHERFRAPLLAAVEGAERIVLLGDVVELRDRPIAAALAAAAPFFAALGQVARGAEVVLVPGNHDHHLLFSWAESRRLRASGRPMGLEQRAKATGGPMRALARELEGCELVLSYPGTWLADRIYAMHGHYLDAHITVPTFERLGVGAVEKLIGGLPHGGRSPDDYERAQAPLYSFLYALAQSGSEEAGPLGDPSARIWAALSDGSGVAKRVRSLLLGSVALPGAIGIANRLGIGRFRSDLSLEEIGRAGVRAMAEAVDRLAIDAEWVVFGHTHRRGPCSREQGWQSERGVRLLNSGSWVYSPALLEATAAASPFWPGTIVVIEDGLPQLLPLLDDFSHDDFRRGLGD